MGWPEVAGNYRKIMKCPVTHGGRRRRFAGPIPARPTAVGREISRPAFLDVLLPFVWCVYSDSGWWCLVWSNLSQLANGQNDPTRVHKFWRASLGFWSSKWCFGARVSFGIQSYVCIGLGLLSGKNLKIVWTLLKHCCLKLPGL